MRPRVRPLTGIAALLALLGCGTPPADSSGSDAQDSGEAAVVSECSTHNPDADADGWCASADCDETNPDVHPEALETCNGVDDDCDGAVDDGVTLDAYPDADLDGFGRTDAVPVCALAEGYVTVSGDCNDGDAAIHPGAVEVCDLQDNNCDGVTDEGDWPLVYADADGDGYGNAAYANCYPIIGYVADATDCDDLLDSVHPGAAEVCDGWDDDCDGLQDEADVDADGDGKALCAGDCDDAHPRVAPGNPELQGDGLDNDCDGTTDQACVDDHCDLHVPADLPTIQAAITAAAAGDTVCVAAGTYRESLDFGGKAVVVVGVSGSAETILEGALDAASVEFVHGEGRSSVLEGFTIDGGRPVWIDGTSPTLVDVAIENTGWTWNTAGGGVYAADGAPAFWDVRVTDGYVMEPNKGQGYGGGMFLDGTEAVLDGVEIVASWAGTEGGGLAVFGGSVGLSRLQVRNNGVSDSWGRGLDGGGGILVASAHARMSNVLVVSNLTGGWAGQSGGGLSAQDSFVDLTNATVCDNVADGGGGGLLVSASSATLTNVIVCDNRATTGGGLYVASSAVTVRYSDLWNNTAEAVYGMADPAGTDGNLAVDPDFADEWYHLDPGSPLLDAGDPTLLDPDGSPSAMGAFGGPRGEW